MNVIDALEFRIMSPEDIKNLARVRIVVSELYDADGFPVEGGVMDPRLGVIDPGLNCRTCGGGIGDCPGHFGYLELAKPIINVLYTKTIYHIMKLTCRKCFRIMATDKLKAPIGEEVIVGAAEADDTEITNKVSLIQPQKCPHCGTRQKKISFVKPYTFYEDKTELSPTDIRDRFEHIPSRDLLKIGMRGGRPEWLIVTLFPVPPVTMRPSITLEGGERSEDDLTHKLVDIVRINQSLKENIDIGAPEFILNDLWELVQYHVSTYFDNELTGAPLARHRSGRALKGLIQRLKAKEGRIRGNLLGKRVNFSARTVISPDPMLSINEVGVPDIVARELTVPVLVTALNEKFIKGLIKEEKVNYVTRPDGRKIRVSKDNKNDIAEFITLGWTVDRHLRDDDIVLFNRQPSLHKASIMAHRVRIMPYRTFRINPSVCPPYNADFDGDEMNLHSLQSEEARAEAALLMDVKNNIISPKFGGPIIGLDLDQITGVYLLTQDTTRLTRVEAAQLFANAGIDIILPPGDSFSGKEIFNLLLPSTLSVKYKSNRREPVEIKNGKIITGVMDSQGMGPFKGKVLNKVVRMYEPDHVASFINNTGRLGTSYLMHRGVSISISDLDLPEDILQKIREEIAKAEKDSMDLIEQYKRKELRQLPGMSLSDSLEAMIMNTLASGVSRVSEIVGATIRSNDIIHLAFSGAKGSLINATQMAAVVGQETILGKRIKRGYHHRTLPHIVPHDLAPGSHGFVARGFKQGLNPFEFFWNIMNGREGLMDKSLRTRKSGYMQRRLVNALQDLKVFSDLSVRNSNSEIVQFVAGEDGLDPSKTEWGTIPWKDKLESAGGKK